MTGGVTEWLLPDHTLGLAAHSVGFLRRLHPRAAVTTPDAQQIAHHAALYALLVTYFPAEDHAEDEVGEGHHLYQATQQTAVTDSLRHLARGVAWYEVRDDAHTKVVKTTEKTVLPLSHSAALRASRLLSRGNNN